MKRYMIICLVFSMIIGSIIVNVDACPTHLGMVSDDTPPFFSDEAYAASDMHVANGDLLFDPELDIFADEA